MNSTEIYKLAEELTEQEVNNIFGGWVKDLEIKSIKSFNALVNLGDSRELACATIIADKFNGRDDKEKEEFYRNAYTN